MGWICCSLDFFPKTICSESYRNTVRKTALQHKTEWPQNGLLMGQSSFIGETTSRNLKLCFYQWHNKIFYNIRVMNILRPQQWTLLRKCLNWSRIFLGRCQSQFMWSKLEKNQHSLLVLKLVLDLVHCYVKCKDFIYYSVYIHIHTCLFVTIFTYLHIYTC